MNWDATLKTLAAIAGVAAYVEVVGGALMWIRFNEADFPPGATVAALPPEQLFVTGATALVVPLLVGSGAAAAQYLISPRNPAHVVPKRFWFVLVLLVGIAWYAVFHELEGLEGGERRLLAVAAAAGALIVWISVKRSQGFARVALACFLFGASYGALVTLVREMWIPPQFDLAIAVRSDKSAIAGLYVARTADHILIARSPGKRGEWQVVEVPRDKVTKLAFGPRSQPVDPKVVQVRGKRLARSLLLGRDEVRDESD